jgi:hypothetical protein
MKLPYKQTDGQTNPTQDSSHERRAPPWLPFFCVNEDTQDSVRQIPKMKTDPQEDPQEPLHISMIYYIKALQGRPHGLIIPF